MLASEGSIEHVRVPTVIEDGLRAPIVPRAFVLVQVVVVPSGPVDDPLADASVEDVVPPDERLLDELDDVELEVELDEVLDVTDCDCPGWPCWVTDCVDWAWPACDCAALAAATASLTDVRMPFRQTTATRSPTANRPTAGVRCRIEQTTGPTLIRVGVTDPISPCAWVTLSLTLPPKASDEPTVPTAATSRTTSSVRLKTHSVFPLGAIRNVEFANGRLRGRSLHPAPRVRQASQ